jgi:thiol:disulfide interchange protein DsbD
MTTDADSDIRPARPHDHAFMCALWERAVRATRRMTDESSRELPAAPRLRTANTQPPSQRTMILGSLGSLLTDHPVVAVAVVFGGGVVTSLTPCIYPMIPITAAIVGGQSAGRAMTFRRSVMLTLSYVVGLALAYASLGLLAGLTGTLFGAISTNPWLYFALANVLALFALMMLEVLPVPVPRRLLTRAATMDGRGRLLSVFGMGAASGLVAAPCGAPVMAALLTWVSATRSATLGFFYLFVFSLGLCSVLVFVGLAAGGAVKLPAAGPWMLWVKRGFAVLMLGVAEYYLVQMGSLLS